MMPCSARSSLAKLRQLAGRLSVGLRVEDERADVAVQPDQVDPTAAQMRRTASRACPDSRLKPKRLQVGSPSTAMLTRTATRGLRSVFARHRLDAHDLVEVVDVHDRAARTAFSSAASGLYGPLKWICARATPPQQRLVVLERRDHLGPRALAVEDAADGLEVVGLVRPGDAHARVAARERVVELAVARHQRALREDEQRRAVLGHEVGDRDAVDVA